ncbi:hypothetical protein BKA69DRAFT_1097093 [Paraphysoderma sedebokerense]|nr:hypothetical protein BKA69DRAFT_1097093 [Paraphysoderma sedebokerense]
MISSNDEYDDVPPLEDMSDQVSQISSRRKQSASSDMRISNKLHAPKMAVSQGSSTISTLKPKVDSTTLADPPFKKPNSSLQPKTSSAFGFKKGFLNSPKSVEVASKTSQSAQEKSQTIMKNDTIPMIKPKRTRENELRLEEVQDAIKSQMSLLERGEWMSESFLTKIEDSETLSKLYSDPAFQNFISLLSSADPQKIKEALSKYGHRPEFMSAMKETIGLMGNEFDRLADNQTPPQTKQNNGQQEMKVNDTNPTGKIPNNLDSLNEFERNLVQKVMNDDEVKRILVDREVQALLAHLKSNGANLPQLIQKLSPSMQRKVQKLIQIGLLSIQT